MAEPLSGAPQPTTNRVKPLMLREHAALNRLLLKLSRAVEGDDPAGVCELWTRFERSLRDHLELEERCIFPLMQLAHRDEVASLLAEHQRIRRALADLGIAADLHALRKASVDELIGYLEQHASREERSLYDCLEDNAVVRHGLRSLFERHAGAASFFND